MHKTHLAAFLLGVSAFVAGSLSASASVLLFDAPFEGSFADTTGNSALLGVVGSPTLSSGQVYAGSQSLAIPASNGNYLRYAPVNLGADDFTMSGAIYLTGPISQYASMFSQWGDEESFQVNITSSEQVQFAAWTAANGEISVNVGPALSLDAWHLITVQRRGTTVTISADGNTLGTTTVNGALDTNNNALWVGELAAAGYTVFWNHGSPFDLDNLTISDDSLPEPVSLIMLMSGLGITGLMRRRQ